MIAIITCGQLPDWLIEELLLCWKMGLFSPVLNLLSPSNSLLQSDADDWLVEFMGFESLKDVEIIEESMNLFCCSSNFVTGFWCVRVLLWEDLTIPMKLVYVFPKMKKK